MTSAYFTQMAGVAATLLGLTFLSLTFFLGSLDHRYKNLAIPVFLHEVERLRSKGGAKSSLDSPPLKMTDLQLFDGDPVVVFLAFSTALSWNFYFFSLILSLTIIDAGLDIPWLIAGELVFFAATVTYSVVQRRMRYLRLNTYRTFEERLWSPGEWLIIAIFLALALLACYAALVDTCAPTSTGVCHVVLLGPLGPQHVDLDTIRLFAIKVVTLGSICLGLYVTNKDLFVFFKARTSDEIRRRWLERFVGDYARLRDQIETIVQQLRVDAPEAKRLRELWRDGRPPRSYIRDGYSPHAGRDSVTPDPRWVALLAGAPDVSAWMFDAPGLAEWMADVEDAVTLAQGSMAAAATS